MFEDSLLKKQSVATKRLETKILRIANNYFYELSQGLKEPEIITVTRVEIAKGKYFVRIWVSFQGLDPKNPKPHEKFLEKCENPFRHYLSQKIDIHKVPPLKFILDDSYYYVKRVNELLTK